MPTLVRSPAPELLATPPRHPARGYRRVYRIASGGAPCLLQRVRVHVRYEIGGDVLVQLRQTYWEFFAFQTGDGAMADDAALEDTHDFDVARDSWKQSVIRRLLRQHRRPGTAEPSGEPEIDVRKSFLLGPGEVRGAMPTPIADRGAFGLLATGPTGPSHARLTVARGDGTVAEVGGIPSSPPGYPVTGNGAFVGSTGWRACEHFRYSFARTTGHLRDRSAYRATALAFTPLPQCHARD